MHLWNVFLLLLRFWEIGMPSQVLLPAAFFTAVVLHGFLRWKKKGCGWWLPALFAAAVLICEVIILLLHSYMALLAVVGMAYSMAALLGTALGELLYQFWTNVHSK